MKRILPILLIITLVASVYAILPFGEAAAEPSIPGGYEMVGRSQNLVLYCNEEARAIAIEDRRNGYTWKSLVDKEVYPDYDSANMMWKNYMQSIIVLNYINLTVKDISNFKAYSSVDATSVKMNRINNGVSMEFNFDTIGISVYTEFFLEGDNLVIRIPADKIREEKDMGLISIELLPFLGAASRYVDGYVFYPDGCGALTRYSNVDQRLQNVRPFTWSIYSSQQVNLREYNDMKRSGKDWAMLPVLGIKNNDNAMLAAVVTGMENCNINVHPEGYAVNLNRIYFEFVYRHFFNTYLSNITVNGRGISKNPVRIKADKEITRLDREVRLFFLHGEQANYSGMAAVYRDYLKKNDLINAAINKSQDIPLGIDFFMGITEERILFDKFIPMTTFKDAQFIINELLGKGINNISVMLKGWTKKGYGLYPTRWPPDNRLGGSKGLMEFTDYIKKNHLELFLQVNFTEGDQKFGGFS
ncbi:MAG: hypothetical protein GX754_02635, partial [Clostridiaceae bacterium]|nr:hypothetical protein [Clostridiaceae bacterium]